nr:MAG TPA: hypothetical protein [Caudoviricetes sp.]
MTNRLPDIFLVHCTLIECGNFFIMLADKLFSKIGAIYKDAKYNSFLFCK